MTREISLDLDDLRAVAACAAENAAEVLGIFEAFAASDPRPREAIDAARAFACGGSRTRALRDASWAAQRAARQTGNEAAAHAARAALCAASAAYLHPLARSSQVWHILGAAAHAARAAELAAGDDANIGTDHIERAARRASARMVAVLLRFPPAPTGGARAGQLMRRLDRELRGAASSGVFEGSEHRFA